MTTQCNGIKLVVFLRLEENLVNSSMNPSPTSQSKNARVFKVGEEGGLEKKGESRDDKSVTCSITSASRVGKDKGGSNVQVGEVRLELVR